MRPLFQCTQLVERLYRRTDLLTVLGFRVHVLNPVHQRGILGAQFSSQLVDFPAQPIGCLGVFLLGCLLDFITELADIAKYLCLDLVAADYFEDLLGIRPGRFWACAHTGAATIITMAIIDLGFIMPSRFLRKLEIILQQYVANSA